MKTLRILIITGLLFALGLNLEAQKINFGVLGGIDISNAWVKNKPENYSDYRVFYPMYSLNINGYVEYKISNTWGISAEPGFIRKGGIARFGLNHYMSSIKLSLYYVQMPVLINFYCKRIFVSLGPEFAYLLNSEESLPGIETGLSNFKDSAFEISVMTGVNYSLSNKLDIGLRYSLGLTDCAIKTWTDGYGPPIGQSNVYNQYFQLILRYKIKPGVKKGS